MIMMSSERQRYIILILLTEEQPLLTKKIDKTLNCTPEIG
jgi:hypothetical protein